MKLDFGEVFSLTFILPGGFKDEEVPDWMEILDTAYDRPGKKKDLVIRREPSSGQTLIHNLEQTGHHLSHVTIRDKVNLEGETRTVVNFYFRQNQRRGRRQAEARKGLDDFLQSEWRSFILFKDTGGSFMRGGAMLT